MTTRLERWRKENIQKPRVNTVKKGKEAEKEFCKILMKEGYSVHRANTKPYERDIFGIVDLLAFDGKNILMIQIKCNLKNNQTIRDIQDFIKKNPHPDNLIFILAVRYDKRKHMNIKWRMWRIFKDRTEKKGEIKR
jgi:Holliday junction resolvase